MKIKLLSTSILLFFIVMFSNAKLVFAESTSGYAWSENTGYIDFSQVSVSNTILTGYAYSPNVGFISLNCSNTSSCGTADYKVTNSLGILSGYAWSENTGYIDFSQATIIGSTGVFSGYAYSPNIGFISLNCSNTSSCGTADYKVTTAWRATGSDASSNAGSHGGSLPGCLPGYAYNKYTSVPCSPMSTSVIASPMFTRKICVLDDTRVLRVTSPQMKGDDVKNVQICINSKKETLSLIPEDGIFGNKTKQAIILFQKKNGLTVDGIVGVFTRNKLK